MVYTPGNGRAAIKLGEGVYLPGIIRRAEGENVDFYRGQPLRDWYRRTSIFTLSEIPLNITELFYREWERLELWLSYDERAGREPIDPYERPKPVNLHKECEDV
ncbi:hypothetical protein [Streptomyces sp. H27-H5]|uniref:hypothetical protein n=1 Tax=Streptomyces sp. H27-H5 TaxID=2996460 RepID=UPI00227224C9|nr:hypothetical protein [Streptomyces sp. H27-H5]MCY0955826.1 hypothetical protein [Streptomyces sp. H27-H5]